jgi:rare lipoprotein A
VTSPPPPDAAKTASAAPPSGAVGAGPGTAADSVVVAGKAAVVHKRTTRAGGGLASWYGDRFHGRPTANGERFDMGGFTAAHRTFPLPSYVRVTNAANGRSIVVRVNDRGPFHGSRVIDVSRRTADVLGFRSSGVGTVKLDYIGRAPDDRSDDRRLLASYQEFGRPSAAPGVQTAALAPVTDGELAAEASASDGGAFAVASAAVANSASAVRSSAAAVASTAKTAIRKVLPAPAEPAAVASSGSAPREAGPPIAYAASAPLVTGAPAAITAPRPAQPRRVIQPSVEPMLASAAPEIGFGETPSTSGVDVSSRIAAGFDSFGPSTTTVRTGGSATFDGMR